jgi:hypothetical protein
LKLEKARASAAKAVADQERNWGHNASDMISGSAFKSFGKGIGTQLVKVGIPALLGWGLGLLTKRAATGSETGPTTPAIEGKLNSAFARLAPIVAKVEAHKTTAGGVYQKWNAAISPDFRKRQTGRASQYKSTVMSAMNELLTQATQGTRTGNSPEALDRRIGEAYAGWQAAMAL